MSPWVSFVARINTRHSHAHLAAAKMQVGKKGVARADEGDGSCRMSTEGPMQAVEDTKERGASKQGKKGASTMNIF